MIDINELQKKWTKCMLYLSIALVIVFFTGEILLYSLLAPIDIIKTSLIKVIVHQSINVVLVLITYFILKSKKLPDYTKALIPLATIFLICINFVFNHYYYPSAIIALSIPVLLSILYTDQKLTHKMIILCTALTIAVSIIVLVLNINDVGFYDDYVVNIVIVDTIILFLIISAATMVKMEHKRHELLTESIRQRNYYYTQARIDELTKTHNRNAYTNKIKRLVEHKERFCIAIVDIDKFKIVNDKYGHKAGDNVLAYLGSLLNRINSETIYTARYGGEEFVVIFLNDDTEHAKQVLEKLKNKFSSKQFEELDNTTVTFSAGIAKKTKIDDETTIFNKADEALYKAKDTGRNKICIFKQ